MYLQEEAKLLPMEDVWAEYLARTGCPDRYYDEIVRYESKILKERK